MRDAVDGATDFDDAARALLELGATWTPDALAALVDQATQLAVLTARAEVLAEVDGTSAFAEPELIRQEFREQIDFLTQKLPKPTQAWTDLMHGGHDRAFAVAGVTDMQMLQEFQQAVIDAAKTYDIKAFGREFDRLVEKYGWSYNGGRSWRVRTIFETNIRTSYMAGRLKQMRDPDVVKIQPFWMYRHADTRVPLNPRAEHVAWDGLVLDWDDPWWDTHFPPNAWRCSCGIRSVSRGGLKRMGKSGPDKAPPLERETYVHEGSGAVVQLPKGIGYGWDHMPGDLWERGLVPRPLLAEASEILEKQSNVVVIDAASPLNGLIADARPARPELARAYDALMSGPSDGSVREPQDFVAPFLSAFGGTLEQASLYRDAMGLPIPISAELFKDAGGAWKTGKRGRGAYIPLMAEALLDPDEIWLGVINRGGGTDFFLERRYVRVIKIGDLEFGVIVAFEMADRWWRGVTAFVPTTQGGRRPSWSIFDARRAGKLVWKRK